MANNSVLPGQTILATKENNLTVGDTAPPTPAEGDLWSDTTGAGTPVLKVWDGAAWQTIVAGTSLIPTGLIAMWSGTLVSIPSGWALCDGAGGRPDLRDKFVRGAAAGAGGGATGGVDSTTHNSGGSHTHNAISDHQHTTSMTSLSHANAGGHTGHGAVSPASAFQFVNVTGGTFRAAQDTHVHDDDAGDHSHSNHSGSVSSSLVGGHTHTSTGSSHSDHGTHDNKPAFYAVLFIIKT